MSVNQRGTDMSTQVQEATNLNGFLRIPQILQLIPVGKSTWWAGVKSGRFPKPVKLGPRITAWKKEDIYQLIETLNSEASNHA